MHHRKEKYLNMKKMQLPCSSMGKIAISKYAPRHDDTSKTEFKRNP